MENEEGRRFDQCSERCGGRTLTTDHRQPVSTGAAFEAVGDPTSFLEGLAILFRMLHRQNLLFQLGESVRQFRDVFGRQAGQQTMLVGSLSAPVVAPIGRTAWRVETLHRAT